MHVRGVGIGLRKQHFSALFEAGVELDFLEVIAENFMTFGGLPARVLAQAAARWPLVVHGLGLSLGDPVPLDDAYCTALATLLARVNAPWFSDHLSVSGGHGVAYHDLLPLTFTESALTLVVEKIQAVAARFNVPFIIENPTYYLDYAAREMSEVEFINEVLRRADCGLLLDVNNVYVNSVNHKFDAYAYLDAIAPGRVMQMHLAGHQRQGDLLLDTHGTAIGAEVMALYQHAVRRFGTVATLIEWDNDVPPLAALLDERSRVIHAQAAAREPREL